MSSYEDGTYTEGDAGTETGGDQPVAVDRSQMPETMALVEVTDSSSYFAMLGIDESQLGSESEGQYA